MWFHRRALLSHYFILWKSKLKSQFPLAEHKKTLKSYNCYAESNLTGGGAPQAPGTCYPHSLGILPEHLGSFSSVLWDKLWLQVHPCVKHWSQHLQVKTIHMHIKLYHITSIAHLFILEGSQVIYRVFRGYCWSGSLLGA